MNTMDQNDCGCCEGVQAQTPASIFNPPGLPAISYRVGSYAQFRASMLARLGNPDLPGLNHLQARGDDDFSIALFDSWSLVADVLTFYQERIANEAYRRTATERGSLLELAHLVDYKLQPGIAANTFLAFTMETALGSPSQTTIDIGTKVQSLPNPGEKPQTFETIEAIEAHTAWNVLKPGLTKDQAITLDMPSVILRGTNTNLRQGDGLLIVVADKTQKSGYAQAFRRILRITPNAQKQQTLVLLDNIPPTNAQGQSAATGGDAQQPAGTPSPSQAPPSEAPQATPAGATQDNPIGDFFKEIAQDINKFGKELLGDAQAPSTQTAQQSAVTALAAVASKNATGAYATPPVAAAVPSLPPVHKEAEKVVALFTQAQPVQTNEVGQLSSTPGVSQRKLEDVAVVQGLSTRAIFANMVASPPQSPNGQNGLVLMAAQPGPQMPVEPGIYALRRQASLFGYNAPDWRVMPSSVQSQYPSLHPTDNDWPFSLEPKQLLLDRVYSQVIPGSWVVVEQPGKNPTITQVDTVVETAAANYALSGKATQLTTTTDLPVVDTFAEHRRVTVYCQSELLAPDLVPETERIQGNSIYIPGMVNGPGPGRVVMVYGQPADLSSGPQGELAILDDSLVDTTGTGTKLNFKNPLVNTYIRDTVSIYGNVARATQGETIQHEVLGSGDASQAYQRFTLRQSPLTYIQAPTPDGKASSLSITVDGLPWTEVSSFWMRGPRERVYVARIQNDGTVLVEFGDGINGARLPTGEDNIVATYRKGIGLQGIVQPGQLSVLQTRPLGVKSVTNPLAPTGADDPETAEDARRNAANTVFTLGRIVSGPDYENFALSFAGVAKAQATTLWTNNAHSVYVTIAGPPIDNALESTSSMLESTQILPGSALYNKIYARMRSVSNPTIPFVLQTYKLVLFTLEARVRISPNYPSDQVLMAVEQRIRDTFSFHNRQFGQSVTLNEVIVTIQAVEGVMTVRIDKFYDILKTPMLQERIDAALPTVQSDGTISSVTELLIASPMHPFYSLEVVP